MHRRLKIVFGAVLASSVLAIGASVGNAGETASKVTPRVGGTIVFGAEQEPSDSLNGVLNCCNLAWASWTVGNPALRGAFQVQPDFSYRPNIISEATVQTNPFRVTYKIRPEAVWYDGGKKVPITANDFIFTWRTYVNPDNDMASRAGYEDMSRVTAINKKTVRVTFKKLYAGWRDLFSGPYGIFPAHALTGQDFNKVWQNDLNNPKTGKPIASGPFYVQSYQRGSQLTLVRNPLYWGKHKAYLNRVIFRFLTSQTTEAQQVRGGEVDAIYPQPNAALIPLRTDRNLVYKVGLGTVWEHLDFQVGPKGHPALKVPAVRKAVAQGIDRSAIIKRLFGEVTGNLATLQNAVYVTNSKYYQPHYNIWKYAPAKSRALLDGLNCTRGGDGIYTCPSVGKLSFSFKTTAGNTRRLNAFTIMQAQLKDVGIQINYEPYPAAVVFGDQHISGHNYDLAYFAWVGTPDPTGYVEIGSCGGSQNYQTYCSRKATALLLKARTILDPDEQAKVFNQADKILANGLPTLPMYQLPDVLIYNKAKVRGMVLNDTQEGPSWNIEDWWVTR